MNKKDNTIKIHKDAAAISEERAQTDLPTIKYEKPKLVRYGNIHSLTTGGSSGGPEMKVNQTNKRA